MNWSFKIVLLVCEEEDMGHLRDAGMTYFQHMRHALYVGTFLILAGVCCVTHSVMPFLFKTTASNIITHLSDNVISRQIQRK